MSKKTLKRLPYHADPLTPEDSSLPFKSSKQLPLPSSIRNKIRLLYSLLRGLFDDAAGFTLYYGLVCCSPCLRQVLSSIRFYAQISPNAGTLAHGGLAPPVTELSPARRCWARCVKKVPPYGSHPLLALIGSAQHNVIIQ